MRLTPRRAASKLFLPTGVKMKAIMQVHKSSDIGGDNAQWTRMWTTTYDWNGWLKPGLDAVQALGANTVKISGPSVGALDIDGVTLLSQVADRMRQYLTYAAQLGLLVYWIVDTQAQWGTTQQLANAAIANAKVLKDYPHVVAYDLWNEARLNTTAQQIADYMRLTSPTVKQISGLPVTFSEANVPRSGLDAVVAMTFDYVDFWDYHAYHYSSDVTPRPVPSDLDNLRVSPYSRPYLIGESGAPRQNPGSFFGGSAEVNAHWQRLSVMSQQPDCLGVVGFCLTDYNNQQFGVLDETLVGQARPESANPFKGWRDVR